MDDEDLVTLVIPTYNSQQFLKENIESILNQTYQNLEIIYICDGCTDNTVDIINQYTCDKRLHIIVNKLNQGAAVSRNIGMNMARGEWLICVDSDDLLEPDMIKEMVDSAKKYDADMCCCYVDYFEKVPIKNAMVSNAMKKKICCTYPVIYIQKTYRYLMHLVDTCTYTKLLNKSIYKNKDVYFQNIPNANDVYYSICATLNSKRIAYVDKVLYHYRSNNGRHTLTTDREMKENYNIEACDMLYKYILEQKNTDDVKIGFYNLVISIVYGYMGKSNGKALIEKMRNRYMAKWGMLDKNIKRKLSCFNSVVYQNILENNIDRNKQDICSLAQIEFVRRLSEKGCSIWGTGLLGTELLGKISDAGIEIQHVFDSSTEKWGKEVQGYIVENFNENRADNIIVTTSKFFQEIKDQIGDKAMNVYNLEFEIWK
jgi:glycosyltransferase involved in cell wall biosynthesis